MATEWIKIVFGKLENLRSIFFGCYVKVVQQIGSFHHNAKPFCSYPVFFFFGCVVRGWSGEDFAGADSGNILLKGTNMSSFVHSSIEWSTLSSFFSQCHMVACSPHYRILSPVSFFTALTPLHPMCLFRCDTKSVFSGFDCFITNFKLQTSKNQELQNYPNNLFKS